MTPDILIVASLALSSLTLLGWALYMILEPVEWEGDE